MTKLFAAPWTAVCQASLPFTISWSLLFSYSVMSDSLLPHGLQHARPGFPALHHSPELAHTHVNWVNDAFQPSPPLLSSCLQSFPAPGSFTMSQLFTSSGQRFGASISASIILTNIQDWFLLGLTRASLITQLVKNLCAMQETLVQFLGQEDPPEKG